MKAKSGEIKLGWSKRERDIEVAWGAGDPSGRKEDAYMTLNHFNFTKTIYNKTFLEELENRGYDLTTIKFSIQRKK